VRDRGIAGYGLLRGYFHGADDDSVDELELQRLRSVTLAPDAAAIGQTLEEALREVLIDVTAVSVRRAHGRVETPSMGLRLASGDTLVISGRPQALARAETLLLKG